MSEEAFPLNLDRISYPDFVALIRQDNTPPGSSDTLKYWIQHADINEYSYVLDLACSTGYSSRYCCLNVNCCGQGIDISELAIKIAIKNSKFYGYSEQFKYRVADACFLPFENDKFTHILGGCNYAFIINREKALLESLRVLKIGGVICVANFYYRSQVPLTVIKMVSQAIDFKPEVNWNLNFWRDFFSKGRLTLLNEKTYELKSQKKNDLINSIKKQIYIENIFTRTLSKENKESIFHHLLKIREPLNIQRNYQGVALQLWSKN